MSGHWRYLEHDWVGKPGTFIYEPAGEAHTLVITADASLSSCLGSTIARPVSMCANWTY